MKFWNFGKKRPGGGQRTNKVRKSRYSQREYEIKNRCAVHPKRQNNNPRPRPWL